MLRSRIIASATLAILVSACASRPPPPITAAQANALPPQQLAEIVLRQLAGRVRSVTRPNYDSVLFPGTPLGSLIFATEPISSAFGGLCEASEIAITFFEGLPSPPPGRNAPVRAQSISTETSYKIVGEIELPYALSQEARARQNLRCAAQAPVIAPEENRLGHRQFFHFRGDLWPAQGAAVLQRLLRSVADGRHTDHRCARNFRCPDPTAMIRPLSLDDLLSVEIERDARIPTLYTVTGRFLESGDEGTITTVEVAVEAEFDHPDPRLVRRLGQATVHRSTLIRD